MSTPSAPPLLPRKFDYKDFDMEPSLAICHPPSYNPILPRLSHSYLDLAPKYSESLNSKSNLLQGYRSQFLTTSLYEQSLSATATSPSKRVWRNVKYPFYWSYFKLFRPDPINETKIMAKYLPVFLVIPVEKALTIMLYVKKHAFKLRDCRLVVALEDVKNCGDSKAWFLKEGNQMVKNNDLKCLEYTKELIEELDDTSSKEFGFFLKELWDMGMKRGEESIAWRQKVRSTKLFQQP